MVGRLQHIRPLSLALLAFCLAASASADPPDRPMTFSWHEETGEGAILAAGVIVVDTPTAFANFLTAHPQAGGGNVWLSSDGGDLEAALDLGDMFRRYGLRTGVGEIERAGGGTPEMLGSRCSSACALAYLGGVHRSLAPGSTIGVHQLRLDCVDRQRAQSRYPWLPIAGTQYCPRLDDGISASQSAQGAVTAYVSRMGVDPMLVSLMSSIDPSGIRVLTEDELNQFGVVTPEPTAPDSLEHLPPPGDN